MSTSSHHSTNAAVPPSSTAPTPPPTVFAGYPPLVAYMKRAHDLDEHLLGDSAERMVSYQSMGTKHGFMIHPTDPDIFISLEKSKEGNFFFMCHYSDETIRCRSPKGYTKNTQPSQSWYKSCDPMAPFTISERSRQSQQITLKRFEKKFSRFLREIRVSYFDAKFSADAQGSRHLFLNSKKATVEYFANQTGDSLQKLIDAVENDKYTSQDLERLL